MSTFLQEFQKTARAAWFPWAEANFSDGSESTALVKDLLNEANQLHSQIAPAKIVDTTIATSNWVAAYDLPSDFSRISDVYYYRWTRKITIQKQTEDIFLGLESVVSSNMLYLYFVIRPTTDISWNVKNQIWLYPTPVGGNSIYIKYYSVTPALDTSASSAADKTTAMVAPAWFGYLNTYWALSNIFDFREQPVQAEQYRKKYKEMYELYMSRIINKSENIVVKPSIINQLNPNFVNPTFTYTSI